MRNMSIEYLRVVFISLIVLLHILWKDYGGLNVMPSDQSVDGYMQLGLTNLTSLGVTGFILISGYYGVRLKVGRAVSLWFQTTIYALISFVLVWFTGGGNTAKGLLDAPLSLFDGGWWFITDYLILMLLSPFLNAGLEKTGKRHLLFVISLFTFIMYGAEWFHAKDASQPLLLFLNTYLVGRYMFLYPISFLSKHKYNIFLIGVLLLMVEPMLLHGWGLDGKMKFVGGNFNVLVLIVDMALLLICLSHKKLGTGNFLTKNVLAVYLIHESGIGRSILHESVFYEGKEFDLLYILLVVGIVVMVSVVIEEMRKRLFSGIEMKLINKVEAFCNLNFGK